MDMMPGSLEVRSTVIAHDGTRHVEDGNGQVYSDANEAAWDYRAAIETGAYGPGITHLELQLLHDGEPVGEPVRVLAQYGMTEAHDVAARFDNDGQCWEDDQGCQLEDVLEDCDVETDYPADGSDVARHEFPDGSAIVTAGACWDLGVHASRLGKDEAGERYLNWGERDLAFAFPSAEAGLTEDDAFPAR